MSKARKSLLIVIVFAVAAAIMFVAKNPTVTKAQKKGLFTRQNDRNSLENYDIRRDKKAGDKLQHFRARSGRAREHVSAIEERQTYGVGRLSNRLARGLKVEYSDDLHVPEVIGSDVREGKAFLTSPASGRRRDILKNFLKENADVVGVEQNEVDGLKTIAEYGDPDGKLSFVELRQEIGGIPVFKGEVKAGFTKAGEMIRIVNDLAPGLAGADVSSDFGDPAAAARAAAGYMNLDPASLKLATNSSLSTDQKAVFGSDEFSPTAEKIYFPTEAGVVVPAWRVLIYQNTGAYYVIVDAATNTMLWRKNLTQDQSQSATYMVYNNSTSLIGAPDSPFPLTPGPVDPSLGTQGTGVSRSLVTIVGNEPPATFNQLGWIPDGGNTTDGNNVQAGLDRKKPNDANAVPTDIDPDGMAIGSPNRVFNFALNPSNPSTGVGDNPLPSGQAAGTCLEQTDTTLPTEYQKAATTQLFYLVNRYHDVMYQLGFNEAAHNFQNVNFTGLGVGGDRVAAQAQDCSSTSNADFTTPADGSRPTMQMYLWPGSSGRATIDGALDADVVIHEHTHGLSNRLHGNAAGLNTNMGQAMGEGWSDFYAHSLLAEPTDPVQGIYTEGGYVTANSFATKGLGNYYYGIRRYPTDVLAHTGGANNKPHNAYTFSYVNKDCNARMNATNFAFAPSPGISNTTCDQVHNMGEVWKSILWEARARFITRLGAAAGNRRMLQLVTDGMKLAPIDPTFLTERDAIIAAAVAGGDQNDVKDLWDGFAARGLGASASIQTVGTGSNNTAVTDGFDLPNLTQTGTITISDAPGDADGYLEPGETVAITIPLTNNTGKTATNVIVTIDGVSVSYGTLTGIQSGTATINYMIPAGAPCGGYITVNIAVTSSLGTVNLSRLIFVGKPAATVASQNFDGVTAPALPSGWMAVTELGGTSFVNSTLGADTAPNSMYAKDPTTIGGGTSLVSPIVSVTSAAATLSFRHSYNTELAQGTVWDGGVLEISVDNGPFKDILTAGGSFSQNGYNTVLGGGNNNPVATRAAWGGNSAGFVTTVVTLPAAANGKLAQLRWRFGADDNGVGTGTDPGWYIDTISMSGAGFVTSYACQFAPPSGSNVIISGRVLNSGGFGIRAARVFLTAGGATRAVVTNSFGYYTFENVSSGQTINMNAKAKGYIFAPRSVQVTGNLTGVNLTAQ